MAEEWERVHIFAVHETGLVAMHDIVDVVLADNLWGTQNKKGHVRAIVAMRAVTTNIYRNYVTSAKYSGVMT